MDTATDKTYLERLRELEIFKELASYQLKHIAESTQDIFKQMGALENDIQRGREVLYDRLDIRLKEVSKDVKEDFQERHRENQEVGKNRDKKVDALENRMHSIEKKIAAAVGIILTMQFLAPYLIALFKGFKP